MCCAIGWIDIALLDIFENRNYEYAADQVLYLLRSLIPENL